MTARGKDIRHLARESALQMLYQWEIAGGDLDEIVATGWAVQARPLDVERDALAGELVRGTAAQLARIDALIEEHTDNWRMSRLSIVDRIILRMGVYELLHRPDTPAAVVIDEALELARTFSTEAAVGFINGVLDAIRRRLSAESASSLVGDRPPGPAGEDR